MSAAAPETVDAPASAKARLPGAGGTSGLLLVLVLLLIGLSLGVPSFLTLRNIDGLLLSVTLIGTLAASMMLVMALGEIDLSIGSTVAFAGVVASLVLGATHSLSAGIGAGVLAGGAVGLVNGAVVAGVGLNSLIATLATMEIVRGLAYLAAGGDALIITDERFFALGSATILGVTIPVWAMLAAFALFGVALRYLVVGRNILAIGGNAEAARLSGVPVRPVKLWVFAAQGLVAGTAGVILAARLSLGDPKTAQGLELGVISACVLGGVPLSGGVASIVGVVTGVFIMGCVQNAMGLLNVPTFYQYLVRGGILLLAVTFDQLKKRR